MEQLTASGLEWLRVIHEYRQPWLDPVMQFFSFLGYESFLLFFIALGYWLFDKRVFTHAALLLLASGFLNAFFKGWVREPRPMLSALDDPGGWSFPSGHSQAAGSVWIYFVLVAKPTWLKVLCLVTAIMIPVSRPYLGVHYVHDIIGGFAIGLITLFLYLQWAKYPPAWWLKLLPEVQVGLIAVISVLWFVWGFRDDAEGVGLKAAAAIVGLWWGVNLDRRSIDFVMPRQWLSGGILVIIGLIGIFVFWIGLKKVGVALGLDSLTFDFFRYILIGLWISYGTPRVTHRFVKMSS